MDIRNYYENPAILHEGTLQPRSAFTSFEPSTGKAGERSLNGEWAFSYYESVRLGRQALTTGSFRGDAKPVTVPSTWQHTGYDRPQYLNTRYPFPVDPPFVPDKNPMGIYERTIEVSEPELTGHVILRFDGVDSCFFLFVNEEYAGYSQVSHAMSEFDITDKLHAGGNLITVCVLKWCDGSYLECQDKFRESGIFRDVDLLIRPEKYLFDYTVEACPDEILSTGVVTITADKAYDFPVTCTLEYCGEEVASGEMKDKTVSLTVSNPKLWNAEQPNLYALVLATPYETIRSYVGFRRIDIRDGVFYVNNVPCKMRGVNYHDSNPYEGARLTREQALQDLTLMKQANINAIRTSHYPKPHWFMEMCDRYGFYIVDEADIETHGASYIYVNGEREVSAISRDPLFRDAYVDRIRLLYERDKNHPSVIIWSLGNESGYGENHIEGAEFLHSKKDGRPVHYEGADRPYRFSLPVDEIDVYSNMYASPAAVADYCNNNPERLRRPYMQCEFCHAMGNGPGDLYENVEQLYSFEHYFGAFVWEWCDHAVYDGTDVQGREHFLYGGDSGEDYHDGNFCMDGLVFPNRRPHTGYLEYKNVIRPIRLASFDRKTGMAEFENMLDYTDAFDRIRIMYEIKEAGKVIATGELARCEGMAFPPRSRVTVSLFGKGSADSQSGTNTNLTGSELKDSQYVIFRYVAKAGFSLVEEGFELGFDEVEPKEVCVPNDFITDGNCATVNTFITGSTVKAETAEYEICAAGSTVKAETAEYEFCIYGNNFEYVFDRELGNFTRLCYRGTDLITRPMQFNILRGYIDNDRNVRNMWEKYGYNDIHFNCHDSQVTVENAEVKIGFEGVLAGTHRSCAVKLAATWTIKEDGSLTLKLDAERNPAMEYLPRFGLRMFVPSWYNTATYFGYGPHESYIDKHRSTALDLFRQNIDEMSEPYIKPQETGSHFGTRYLIVSSAGNASANGDGGNDGNASVTGCGCNDGNASTNGNGGNDGNASILVCGKDAFSFNFSRYTAESQNRAAHFWELTEEPDNVLCIDYKMSGCGSNSCGPELDGRYRMADEKFSWEISLCPGK